MRKAEIQMSRIKAGFIRYNVPTSLVEVHNNDVLVEKVHCSENGKRQLSPKLNLYCKNRIQIRNQESRLRRNTLFSGRKERFPQYRLLTYLLH